MLENSQSFHRCATCGADLMDIGEIAAGTCPYCGNNVFISQMFTGELYEPDRIIPFKITEAQALAAYREHLETRSFIPKGFKKNSRIVSIQGVYVPFWCFSGTAVFDVVHRIVSPSLQIAYTSRRAGFCDFHDVPVDASLRMPDDLMDSMSPFYLDQAVPFGMGYLAGFIAERFSEPYQVSQKRAERQLREGVLDLTRPTHVLEQEVETEFSDIRFGSEASDEMNFEDIVLPVWLIVVEYDGKRYLAGVNGQTGKAALDCPIDERAVRGKFVLDVLAPAVVGVSLTVLVVMAALTGPSAKMNGSTLMLLLVAIIVVCIIWGWAKVSLSNKTNAEVNRLKAVKERDSAVRFFDQRTVRYTLKLDVPL